MNDRLTKDEFEALVQIRQMKTGVRASACVSRNAKKLIGLKYVTSKKDGTLALTEKGQQTVFIKRSIDALQAVANAAAVAAKPAALDADVATFLSRKGLITPNADGFELTERGRESLADMHARDGERA